MAPITIQSSINQKMPRSERESQASRTEPVRRNFREGTQRESWTDTQRAILVSYGRTIALHGTMLSASTATDCNRHSQGERWHRSHDIQLDIERATDLKNSARTSLKSSQKGLSKGPWATKLNQKVQEARDWVKIYTSFWETQPKKPIGWWHNQKDQEVGDLVKKTKRWVT